jgi:PadR family transcriptional regulator PadR
MERWYFMKGQRLGEFEELILLAIRAHLHSAHSVGIQTVLEEEASRRASLGAIYAALERLERKGHVESWLGEPTSTRGGRSKRHYSVTAYGEEAIQSSRDIRNRMWANEGRGVVDEQA